AHVTAVEQFDAREPFHPGDAKPAGHDEPQRRAVGLFQRLAVHFISQQDVVALQHVTERKAAGNILQLILVADFFNVLIRAEENDYDGAAKRMTFSEQRGERRAGPVNVADSTQDIWNRAIS